MRVIIQHSHLEITNALRAYAQRRLKSLDHITRSFEQKAELLLQARIGRSTRHHHKGSGVYVVELELSVPGKIFHIEECHANVRAAIDGAQKRMKETVGQYKDKYVQSRKLKVGIKKIT